MYLRHLNNVLSEGGEENDNTNLLLKIISIVVFLAMAMGFGVMPYFIKKCRTSTKFLSVSNAFSGGLFLGIGLFHVLPESHEMLEQLTEAPLAYFCAFLSYALILFVEKVSFNSHSLLHGHGHSDKDTSNRTTLSKLNDTETERETETVDEHNDEEEEEKEQKEEKKEKEENEENEKKEPMIKVETPEKEENQENDNDKNEEHDHEHHKHKGSSITPYILLLALGFHGLFEGMALGIQSDIQSTLSLFLAIVAHKWAASLTLGISFVKAGVARNQLIIMVMIFAFIGPVGVAIGLILSETADEIIQGIFLAISVGTFLYIACSEVLVEEFENPKNKYLKFMMFMLGGIFIGGLSLLEIELNIEE